MKEIETKAQRNIQPPNKLPDNAAFWAACSEGCLLVKRCLSCGKAHWYPRVLCPFCFGETKWEDAGTKGVVYTYSITRRAGPNPYCIAYVELPHGILMMTNIVDCDFSKIRIGSQVSLVFHPDSDGGLVPMFTLTSP